MKDEGARRGSALARGSGLDHKGMWEGLQRPDIRARELDRPLTGPTTTGDRMVGAGDPMPEGLNASPGRGREALQPLGSQSGRGGPGSLHVLSLKYQVASSKRVGARGCGRILRILAGFTLFVASDAGLAQDAGGLSFHIETEKTRFHRGEEIHITGLVCNHGDSPHLTSSCDSCIRRLGLEIRRGAEVVAFHQSEPFDGCGPGCAAFALQPGECHERYVQTWNQRGGGFPWPGDGEQVAPGVYSVVHGDADVRVEILSQGVPIPSLSQVAMLVMAMLFLLVGLGASLWRSMR